MDMLSSWIENESKEFTLINNISGLEFIHTLKPLSLSIRELLLDSAANLYSSFSLHNMNDEQLIELASLFSHRDHNCYWNNQYASFLHLQGGAKKLITKLN